MSQRDSEIKRYLISNTCRCLICFLVFRHAYNIQIREVNSLVTKAVAEFPLKDNANIEPPQYIIKFKQVLLKKKNRCKEILLI